MSTRTRTLPNHRIGVREVMLDQSGKVLPVISATRVSYTPDRVTTYQRPCADGFVVRCEVKAGEPMLSLNRFIPHLDIITPVSEDTDLSTNILSKLDDDLVSWLKDVDALEQSNLLPAGFGWDGVMTETEYSKYERVRDLFISTNEWTDKDRIWFEDIVHQAVRTSNMYLNLDWGTSFKLIKGKIPIHRPLPLATKVYLVTFDKTGKREVKLIRRPIIVGSKKPVQEIATVPDGTVRAILLRTNVMVDEESSYGVSIDLFNT